MAFAEKLPTPRCRAKRNHLIRTNHALRRLVATSTGTALVAQGAAPFAGPEVLLSCAHGVEKVELSPVNNVALFALNRVHRE